MYDSSIYLREATTLRYKIFKETKSHPLNLNIVGWRHTFFKHNKFNDWLSVYWQDSLKWSERHWRVTTLPGVPWLFNPINKDGTAVLVPGQYINAYALGEFKGYRALKQVAPVRVFRDNNRDGNIDLNPEKMQSGLFGIHIHKAGIWSQVVGQSSAGCQVFQRSADFNEFIDLCSEALEFWGNRFSYTLMEI